MSKITNVRLPNVTSSDYNAEQFNQLVRSLEQVVLQLNSSYTSYVSENQGTARTWFGI
jgi:exonuclease VII small subunit